MPKLDREGDFEARVINAEMYGADSGAIAVNLEFEVVRQYDKPSKTYSEQWPAGHTFRGSVWLVKKDGSKMPDNVKRLARAIGWSGNPDKIGEVIGAICKCKVELDNYRPDNPEYKATFINPAGEVDTSAIAAQYGDYFQAIAAEVGPIAPASTPKASTPAPAPAPVPAPPDIPETPASDTVPF